MKIYRVMYQTDADPEWHHDTAGQRVYFKHGNAKNAVAQKKSRDRWSAIAPRPIYKIEQAEVGQWEDAE